MSKSSKVMIVIMLCILTACAASIGIVSVVKSHEANQVVTDSSGNPALVIGSTTTTAPVIITDLKTDIIGKWSDSSGMMGYEFFENGMVNVTYVNLTVPVVNIPINGTAKGAYNINGDVLTVNFSIYSGNIKKVYTARVDNNTLILTDHKDGDITTMMRSGTQVTIPSTSSNIVGSTIPSSAPNNSIVGVWKSSDNNVEYDFHSDGTIAIKLFGNNSSSSFTGVYLLNNNEVTIQYTADGKLLTNKFTYSINDPSLVLTDENKNATLFVRNGSSSQALLGKWADSSGMSGYEFNKDGTVKVTYVNLTVPVVNIPITGTFNGSYTVNGDTVKISYSIYSNSVTDEYRYSVTDSALTLTNLKNNDVTSYIRQ